MQQNEPNMNDWKPYYEFDLNELKILPENWAATILKCIEEYGIDTILDGEGSTSREKSRVNLPVRVIDGNIIKEKISWLHELYKNELKKLCSSAFGVNVYESNSLKSAININSLSTKGKGYEWHVDSNPITGLLFVTSSPKNSGGDLVFRNEDGYECLVKPKAGLFICFDARKIPHAVRPLSEEFARVSVPMNYYLNSKNQKRPEDLDQQIYSERR